MYRRHQKAKPSRRGKQELKVITHTEGVCKALKHRNKKKGETQRSLGRRIKDRFPCYALSSTQVGYIINGDCKMFPEPQNPIHIARQKELIRFIMSPEDLPKVHQSDKEIAPTLEERLTEVENALYHHKLLKRPQKVNHNDLDEHFPNE